RANDNVLHKFVIVLQDSGGSFKKFKFYNIMMDYSIVQFYMPGDFNNYDGYGKELYITPDGRIIVVALAAVSDVVEIISFDKKDDRDEKDDKDDKDDEDDKDEKDDEDDKDEKDDEDEKYDKDEKDKNEKDGDMKSRELGYFFYLKNMAMQSSHKEPKSDLTM